MFMTPVIKSEHLGKIILTGSISLREIAEQIRSGALTVNPEAQRSLGHQSEITQDLLITNDVMKSKRMISFCNFMDKVLKNLEHNAIDEGFLGCLQLIVDESSDAISLDLLDPTQFQDVNSNSLALFFAHLGRSQSVGVMKAQPSFGQAYAQIGDGQGRSVGTYCWYQAFMDRKATLMKEISRKEKLEEDAAAEKFSFDELKKLEPLLNEVFDTTRIPFVIYGSKIENKVVKGLSLDAQRRLYIEGNALNSQASTEQILKYETYSPTILDLINLRTEVNWMSPDFIEENSKSIGKSSQKLFTLSALAKAHSFAISNHDKPIENVSEKMIAEVENRHLFVGNFWKKVEQIFGTKWLKYSGLKNERIGYLKDLRDIKRDVSFQGIFLQALGQVCYTLGKNENINWNEEHSFDELNTLSSVDWNAFSEEAQKWNPIWTNALMKQNKEGGYVFNNVADSIKKTRDEILSHITAPKEEEQQSLDF
ncbi:MULTISPECIES: DNA sulfur modification protein DndB [unclassified Photobacterium]|uniref:DNA sulfur modification protein DndB n=1 Tax=unclassified Photobacterium TaxID=2628852 RepID=UPI001EDFD127|nr:MULTISPECIES: DNA sulfur modification protein DndB [unclassified Photobacterium]MCG3865807.1 hypothetical protein [Photobacterium sp. Ph6]MCG3877282.1 hypothetical protein [Photobacterium sp. Ph5]